MQVQRYWYTQCIIKYKSNYAVLNYTERPICPLKSTQIKHDTPMPDEKKAQSISQMSIHRSSSIAVAQQDPF